MYELFALIVADEVVEFVVLLIYCWISRPWIIKERITRKLFVVSSEPHQVIVTRYHPEFVQLVPMDWIFIPDPAVVSVWILDNFRSEHVIIDCRNHIITKYSRIMPLWSCAKVNIIKSICQ